MSTEDQPMVEKPAAATAPEIKEEEMPAASLESIPEGKVFLKASDEDKAGFEVEKKFAFVSKLVSQALENGIS
jgi:hypothetical protein